jgi:hypothetical protein
LLLTLDLGTVVSWLCYGVADDEDGLGDGELWVGVGDGVGDGGGCEAT